MHCWQLRRRGTRLEASTAWTTASVVSQGVGGAAMEYIAETQLLRSVLMPRLSGIQDLACCGAHLQCLGMLDERKGTRHVHTDMRKRARCKRARAQRRATRLNHLRERPDPTRRATSGEPAELVVAEQSLRWPETWRGGDAPWQRLRTTGFPPKTFHSSAQTSGHHVELHGKLLKSESGKVDPGSGVL